MSDQSPQLSRAVALIERAAGDQEILGVALLALQAALAERLRALLASNSALSEQDRDSLDLAGVAALVELGRRHGDLGRDQVARIVEAERLRQSFIRGEPFRGSPGELRAYGQFVAELCDAPELALRALRAPTTKLAPPDDDDDDGYEDMRGATRYDATMRWVWGLAFLALVALGAWLLLGRTSDAARPRPSAERASAGPTATFAPISVADAIPTAQVTPTQAARRARIVRLGGGPGWLHQEPRFDSPTLPPRLSEGQEVALLDRQATDAQGTLWLLVATGGYEGWSPANNIEAFP